MIRFAERYPVLFTLILIVILVGGQVIWMPLLRGTEPLVVGLPGKVTICIIIALIASRMRWWRESGFGQRLTWRTLREYTPGLLVVVPPLLLLVTVDTSLDALHTAGYALMMLMTGFSEELAYRGLSLRAFMPSGWLRAVILSSLIFGAGHLFNVIVQPLDVTLSQSLGAGVAGLFYATIRLTSGDIIPAIAFHGLSNFLDSIATSSLTATAMQIFPAWYPTLWAIVRVIQLIYCVWRLWLYSKQHAPPTVAPPPELHPSRG
jgi:membrane protease YdiL (CAAX protease family)